MHIMIQKSSSNKINSQECNSTKIEICEFCAVISLTYGRKITNTQTNVPAFVLTGNSSLPFLVNSSLSSRQRQKTKWRYSSSPSL